MDVGKDWKNKLGFPINYDSDQSSEDEFDAKDVVMRPRHSSVYLLNDQGDGAEADLMGTTPPRERIRNNQKRKTFMDTILMRDSNGKRDDASVLQAPAAQGSERMQKNLSLSRKFRRARERDVKQDSAQRESKADSLPPADMAPAVPTVVESSNRFMSLTSRLKCREPGGYDGGEVVERRRVGGGVGMGGTVGVGGMVGAEDESTSRANFHNTFSLLINMGNIDKGCKRTISREEQVWQNELKDLIWLELQAKIAGRTLAQQDAYLCAQRNVVPTIVHNIRNYRFVNPNPCRSRSSRLCVIKGSLEDLSEDTDETECEQEPKEDDNDVDSMIGCLSFNCRRCSEAVGKAMREVGTLLDSFYNATTLYPSSKAMTADHPLIATQLFKNRIKAMCLWYNTALYMRMKVLAVRRMLRVMQRRSQGRARRHLRAQHSDDDASSQSSESRPCAVRFNVAAASATPTDSNNSDTSGHSDASAHKDSATDEPESPPAPAPDQGEGEADEVDSGHDKILAAFRLDPSRSKRKRYNTHDNILDQSGQTTPEIVLPDNNKYGTSDTVTSTESGYGTSRDAHAHAPSDPSRHNDDVYDIGSLEDMTRLRLLDRCPVSQYRSYHHEMLKTQGVRRCMMFMNKMRLNVLHKVYLTLEKPESVKPESVPEDDPVEVFDDTKEDEEKATNNEDRDFKKEYELRRYGCWSEESVAMRLPSYRHHFLLLSSVCMEAVFDYLSLRLEDRPQNPSCLTVKQLIHELKEGLDIATEMRAAFAKNIEVALAGHTAGATARQDLLLLIRTYDATVETVLKQYLSYVRTMSEVEHLSRWTLQAEWSFTARLAKRTKCAALLAPVTFSEIACNQLDRILKQFDEKFSQLEELDKSETDPKKQVVYALCREAQGIYASEREATLQAAQWARALAARLARAPPPAYTTQRGNIFNSLMSLRDRIVQQTQYILERSRAAPDEPEELLREYEGVFARVRELLLQIYKLGFELHKELYKFAQAPFKLLDERCVKRQRPASLQPVRRARSGAADLRRRRPETMLVHDTHNPMVHKELHRFVNESWGSRGALGGGGGRRGAAAGGPGGSPPRGRARFTRSESIGEDAETNVFDDKLFENINSFNENQTSSIELLLSGEPAPIEPAELKPCVVEARISEQEAVWAARVGRAVVQFARCWMRFVVERCDTGRGLRPRWASQGLEFLMLACDPCNTKHLTDKEFEELKKEMDGCISHVIGTRHPNQHSAPRAADSAAASPDPSRRRPRHSPMSTSSTSSAGKDVPAPPTPPTEPDPLLSFQGLQPEAHGRRVLEAVTQLDSSRDDKLRDLKKVGRVLESAAVSTGYEPKLRQLKFKWQRGLKIGAGTFGKVYTVVNTESGQLLAMKELSVGAGDRRALQRAANELRVLEGVVHPHLVRYYGCELHREEMLLFMELCVEGSLEALIATSGALAEHTVRRYTKQLLSAVRELHARAIAHRDIKSGNIFLTNEGHCLKLGDFGCAVKIRANTTAAGELQGHVGTQAYMAPEVFMKSTGHGRAADIWSLGCVVTEMASGKRPFFEYDSNYQIMFVVGMGGRPLVPDTLSQEGQQFCRGCLTHEPDDRPRAESLMLHHFLKVKSDDDCKCEPAYLLA